MRTPCIAVALAALIALPALAQGDLTVNGQKIPASAVEEVVKQAKAQGQADTPELRKMIRDQLVVQELLFQRAQSTGYTKKEELKAQADKAAQTVYIRAMMGDYMKSAVKDSDIQAEYDRAKAQVAGEKEYDARHILVDKEDDAKALIAKLKGGAKFEALAKASSKDSGSAVHGGSLGYAPAGRYVPEFGEALKKLAKGQFTETPVKTQFGFHIIRLENVRPMKMPPVAEVRGQIMQSLQQQKFEELKAELRKGAKISE